MMPRRPLALGCILLATHAAQTHAQTSAPTVPPTPTLNANSTLVLVPALVRNKSGDLVFSLNADDFALTDDGVPQKLTLEEDTDAEPLALVVLIEAGAATSEAGWHPDTLAPPPDRFSTLPAMVEALTGNVPHRIAVVGFDSGPELLQDFTPNIDSVEDAIHYMDTGIDGDGKAAILDALGFSLDLLRRQPPQYRRAILLLSETNDRGSKLRLDDALRAVSDTNTVIYSLAYSTGNTDASQYGSRELPAKHVPGTFLSFENPHPNPPHGCMGKDPDPQPHATHNQAAKAYDCLTQLLPPLAFAKMAAIAATEDLQRDIPETVARLTGGEYFRLGDAKSLERDLQIISNHIHNRYVLSFQPQSPHPGFHAIALTTPNYLHLEVSARNGYWAEPRPTPGQ
jgi:VWFA-related protein